MTVPPDSRVVAARWPGRDLQALSLVQKLAGKAFPSAQNLDPDEPSFRIEVEDDLARRFLRLDEALDSRRRPLGTTAPATRRSARSTTATPSAPA
jgi:hypothetical protein